MSQYKTLDYLIIARLFDRKAVDFTGIDAGPVRVEANRLAAATGRKSYRVIDARLQALRKRGAIQFTGRAGGRGWELSEK